MPRSHPEELTVQGTTAAADFFTYQGADDFAGAFGVSRCFPNARCRSENDGRQRSEQNQHTHFCHLLPPPIILHPQVSLRGKPVKTTTNSLNGSVSVVCESPFAVCANQRKDREAQCPVVLSPSCRDK